MAIRLRATTAGALAHRFGGATTKAATDVRLWRVAPPGEGTAGDLVPLLHPRFAAAAEQASARGAIVLTGPSLGAVRWLAGAAVWSHPSPDVALAELLAEIADVDDEHPPVGEGTMLGPNVVIGPRVAIGKNVVVGAGSVLGAPGFGWVTRPDGTALGMPHLGGVVIGDDVSIGPLCTVDAGTLGPTRLERGVKLDAHVHVAHNCFIGEDSRVAAQSGFAGSVHVGRNVWVGGQAGIADHVTVGDHARIAAKSGVIGDVDAGAVVAGYPAVPRARWLRSLAWLYRKAGPR